MFMHECQSVSSGEFLRLLLSKVELESLPLPAHDSAAGAAATHRCTPCLDSDDGAADDLANAITANTTDALRTCKCRSKQNRPATTCAIDL